MSVAIDELAPSAMDCEANARELFHDIRTLAELVGDTLDAAFAELESLTELVIRAHENRAWRYIDHMSWEDCCKREFGAIRLLRLPREMRRVLHQALRGGGLSVRQTAAVTGCSKNTVLEDCPSEKASQTETPEVIVDLPDEGAGAPVGENVTLDDPPERPIEHFNAGWRPATSQQTDGPADLMGKVAGAGRALSCDIANLVSLAKLARREGKTDPDVAEYLRRKVDAWIGALGSMVEDVTDTRAVTP